MQPVGRARVTKCARRAAASHALNLRAAGLAVLQRSITLHTACMARVSVFFTHVSVDHPQGPVIFTEVCSAAGGSTLFPAVVSFVFFGGCRQDTQSARLHPRGADKLQRPAKRKVGVSRHARHFLRTVDSAHKKARPLHLL